MAQRSTFAVRFPAGSSTQLLANTTSAFVNADVLIDRTGNGGLNSLAATDTLTLSIDYSLDGGTTWLNVEGATFDGGIITSTKNGVTVEEDSEEMAITNGSGFPVGTAFRIRTVASSAVRVSATVTYT